MLKPFSHQRLKALRKLENAFQGIPGFYCRIRRGSRARRAICIHTYKSVYFITRGKQIQGIRFDRVPEELWTEVHDIVQETGIKTIPMEKTCKEAKWLSEEAIHGAVKRREGKSKGEKVRYKHLNAEFQRITRRDKKAFLSDQCKEIEENNRMGKSRDLSRKLEIPRKHFMQRWA